MPAPTSYMFSLRAKLNGGAERIYRGQISEGDFVILDQLEREVIRLPNETWRRLARQLSYCREHLS